MKKSEVPVQPFLFAYISNEILPLAVYTHMYTYMCVYMHWSRKYKHTTCTSTLHVHNTCRFLRYGLVSLQYHIVGLFHGSNFSRIIDFGHLAEHFSRIAILRPATRPKEHVAWEQD